MSFGRIALAACTLGASLALAGSLSAAHGAALAHPASCAQPVPHLDAPGSDQLITVVAPSFSSVRATVTLYHRSGGCFVRAAGPFSAWLGGSGLSEDHHEGDGTTPAGLFSIGPTMYGVLPNPGLRFSYQRLGCGDWWDEDPSSSAYNRFVPLACGATPNFGGDSEALWRAVPAYDYFAVIDYNAAPTVPGRGSAIFFHVSTDSPTTGCVSLPSGDLLAVLRALVPSDRPLIAIGSTASIATLHRVENL